MVKTPKCGALGRPKAGLGIIIERQTTVLRMVIGRTMDPYHVLGVRRGCTRGEVKAAFRARAWRAHPDRGGSGRDFIRLCTAYKQIILELDRNPSSDTREPEPATPSRRSSTPPGAGGQGGRRASRRAARNKRSPKPPDPTWKPDMVLLDPAPRDARRSKPPDPDWAPDMVLLDLAPGDLHAGEPPDPGFATQTHVSWPGRTSAWAARGESVWRSKWARVIGTMILLGVNAALLWLCWVAWKRS